MSGSLVLSRYLVLQTLGAGLRFILQAAISLQALAPGPEATASCICLMPTSRWFPEASHLLQSYFQS